MINLMIINLLKLTMMVILLSKKKNNMAKLLKDRRFIQRVVKPKKGKGSFTRKKKVKSTLFK